MKSISVRVEGKGQFVNYIEHGKIGSHKVRVSVRLGGHGQSWGKVEAWDGNNQQWNSMVHTEVLKVDLHVGYKPGGAHASDFQADRDRLIVLAKEVFCS